MLEARDIVLRARGLRGVSLSLLPGQLHALVGPNGAGKSSLLRVLAGELQPEQGSVQLDGETLSSIPARTLARRRAVMMQREHLPFPFTAGEVVALGRWPWGDGETDAGRRRVIDCLVRAGADALAARRYPQLSGGERARVQFARALAQLATEGDRPSALLLDEPTASLDYAFQHRCLAEVRRHTRAGGMALVIVQDPALALRYADRVTLLKAGEVVACGAAAETLDEARLRAVYELPADWLGPRSGTG